MRLNPHAVPRAISVLAVALALTTSSIAHAQMTFISQRRNVSVSGFSCGSQSESAPDFDPFAAIVLVSGGRAEQDSMFTETQIVGTGLTGGYIGGCPNISGASWCSVTFSIPRPVSFTFVRSTVLSVSPPNIRLTGPNTDVWYFAGGPFVQTATGVLQPGEYSLVASCSGGSAAATLQRSTWDINFTVAFCRADFDTVGGVTVQDVLEFLTAWFSNDHRADFNTVGGVTVQDVFDFLTAWFAGC